MTAMVVVRLGVSRLEPFFEVARGVALAVPLKEDAQRLAAGERIGARQRLQRREDKLRFCDRQLSLDDQPRAEPGRGRRVAIRSCRGKHQQDPEGVTEQDWAGELVGCGDDDVRVAGPNRAVKPRDR